MQVLVRILPSLQIRRRVAGQGCGGMHVSSLHELAASDLPNSIMTSKAEQVTVEEEERACASQATAILL
jgi:hypothetical protein